MHELILIGVLVMTTRTISTKFAVIKPNKDFICILIPFFAIKSSVKSSISIPLIKTHSISGIDVYILLKDGLRKPLYIL